MTNNTNNNIGIQKDNFSAVFPAGTYYIGDICYCLNDDEYDNIWGKKYEYKNGNYGFFAVGGTAYGDGCFYSGKWYFPVDAGVIGVVEISHDKQEYNLNECGRIVTVENQLTFNYDKRGIFEFDIDGNNFIINTMESED